MTPYDARPGPADHILVRLFLLCWGTLLVVLVLAGLASC